MKQFCPFSHDTFIVGRSKSGHCSTCRLREHRLYMAKRKLKEPRIEMNSSWKRRGIKDIENQIFTDTKYDIAYAKQKGCCAICEMPQTLLYVDHDHTTGFFRGLLCSPCNISLGHYEKLRSKAEIYLANHEDTKRVTISHL